MIRSLDLVPGLIDMGATETVVLGVGRVQLVGSDLIRIAFYDESPDSDEATRMIRQIKAFHSWPLQRWLAAQRTMADVVNWVQRDPQALSTPRPAASRIVGH